MLCFFLAQRRGGTEFFWVFSLRRCVSARDLFSRQVKMMTTDYLTAKEVAAELGISLPTLYAYVSRGLIRSEEAGGKTRAKRYRREDVEGLRARKEMRHHPEVAMGSVTETATRSALQSALHWGAPLLESGITLIDNGRLFYRGHDAIALPDAHTFADVAQLIWGGELGNGAQSGAQFEVDTAVQWRVVQQLWPLIAGLSPIERFQAVLPLAAAHDLAGYDLQATAVIQTGQRIVSLLAIAATGQPISGSVAAALQQAWLAEETAVIPLLEAALIYCADHELNVSAFAARVVASARATPYAAVMAGLAALQGSLHGGATERVDAFFREVGTPENARAVIASRLRRSEPIPGFGHPLYPEGDPRGAALWGRVTAVYAATPGWQLAQQIMVEMETAVNQRPTIDFALVALAWAAGLPPGTPLALFAMGRTVGWIGHVLEQYGREQLIRPRARYVGVLPANR
jgi:citrate synthase